jgi:chromosome segregation ATPase
LARRTERLARRRIEATLPMTVAEFSSERDQLRAALAVKEARLEKKAEVLSTRHAEMLAQVGRANARLAALEQSSSAASDRHGEMAAERRQLASELGDTSAALEAERLAHASVREQFILLDAAQRELAAAHERLTELGDQHRVEVAALQAEKEALLGRIEGMEAAHKSRLEAQHDAHIERLVELESEFGGNDERAAELEDELRQSRIAKTEAEARASDLATRLAASDAHGARLALDLDAAKERLGSLASLHRAAQRQAMEAAAEVEALQRKLGAESERAELAEASERLHVGNAVTELHKLEQALESEKAGLGAAAASLDEARAERDRLRAETAGLAAQAGPSETAARREGEAREELVAMIERLADDIAHASGAGSLPQPAAPRSSSVSHAAAE